MKELLAVVVVLGMPLLQNIYKLPVVLVVHQALPLLVV
jgi:hypothetical protein